MSWPALKWALKKRVPASQKSALITLARRQPDDLRPFARPMATLAKETGLSVGGFKLVLAALVDKGLLVIKSTGNRPCTYDLQLSSASHDVASKRVASKPVASNLLNVCSPVGDQPASHSVTTKKHSKETTKNKHSSSRSREKVADERFGQFVEDLSTYWKHINPQLPFDFADRDGSALKNLLKSKRSLTRQVFQECLRNRCRSDEVNHTEEFYTWLPRVMKYAGGSLNKYQKPKGGSDDQRLSHFGSSGPATKADATSANARSFLNRSFGGGASATR